MNNSQLRTLLTGIAVGAAVALGASNALAATISWNLLPNPNTSPGNSLTVMSVPGGIPITLDGFTSMTALATSAGASGTPNAALFEKSAGAGETGLGLTNDPDNEISGTNLIRLNFVSAFSQVTSFTFQMGSTDGGEAWAIFGSDVVGGKTGYTQIASVGNGLNDEGPHTLTGSDLHHWYIFELNPLVSQPAGANVLLGSPLSATSAVPEPATWGMMLVGFLGLGFAFRQSRRKVSFA